MVIHMMHNGSLETRIATAQFLLGCCNSRSVAQFLFWTATRMREWENSKLQSQVMEKPSKNTLKTPVKLIYMALKGMLSAKEPKAPWKMVVQSSKCDCGLHRIALLLFIVSITLNPKTYLNSSSNTKPYKII